MTGEVKVSRARCIASKCCVNLAPEVFALALITIGCSKSSTSTTTSSSAGPTATTTQSLGTTTTAVAAGALSGTWSGEYQQTAPTTGNGTFALTWQQSGSDLSGNITVMGGAGFTSTITGKLEGGNIRF